LCREDILIWENTEEINFNEEKFDENLVISQNPSILAKEINDYMKILIENPCLTTPEVLFRFQEISENPPDGFDLELYKSLKGK
jgi:hypothetical protein